MLKIPYKIAFFDIDGTLIDMKSGYITEKVKKTLMHLQDSGVRLCLATGRGPMILPDFGGVKFDAVISFNGSYCYAGDKVIRKTPLPAADVAKIVQNAAELGRPIAVATSRVMETNGLDDDLEEYISFSRSEPVIAGDFGKLLQQDIYQIMAGSSASEHSRLIAGTTGCKIAAWWDRAVDIIPSEGGKGVAVQEVLRYFQLEAEDAIAFGDGENDIDMLQAAGLGVAMGNASDRVKEMADEVCGSVEEDGIAMYFSL
ncbi:MAG: HAD family hydrolase [Selenomonas sp.]|nr:HAD family hydrolase [Selenomonas sp.]